MKNCRAKVILSFVRLYQLISHCFMRLFFFATDCHAYPTAMCLVGYGAVCGRS